MRNKKLFGIMMGLILIVVPFMSMNIGQVQSVNEEMTDDKLQTDSYWDIGGRGWVYSNLGYLRGNWHEIVDWSFWDADRDLTVMFMTEANYQLFKDGSSYSRVLLSSDELSDSGSFVVSSSNYYRVVYYNDNFLRNTFYMETGHDAIEVEIVSTSFNYYDNDLDGYDDEFRLNLKLEMNYDLASSVIVEYTIFVSGEKFTGRKSVSFMETIAYLYYDVEVSKTYFLEIFVYYSSSSIPDAEAYPSTKQLYPLGYGITPTPTPTPTVTPTPTPTTSPDPNDPENDKPLGLYIGLPLGIVSLIAIAVPVSVVLIKRKRRKSTSVGKIKDPTICPECMEATEGMEIFCGNCGAKLNEVET